MSPFEVLLWLAFGILLASSQMFFWTPRHHPVRTMLTASIAALIGGVVARFAQPSPWDSGAFSPSALIAAGMFALAALIVLASLTPHDHHREET
jgi:hypothetical protein